MNTTETNNETHSLTRQELRNVNSAGISQSTPDKSEKVARQIRVVTDSLTKLLKLRCYLMEELRQALLRRSGRLMVCFKALPEPPNHKFDSISKSLIEVSCDWVVNLCKVVLSLVLQRFCAKPVNPYIFAGHILLPLLCVSNFTLKQQMFLLHRYKKCRGCHPLICENIGWKRLLDSRKRFWD